MSTILDADHAPAVAHLNRLDLHGGGRKPMHVSGRTRTRDESVGS
jgi:hypothetical protein